MRRSAASTAAKARFTSKGDCCVVFRISMHSCISLIMLRCVKASAFRKPLQLSMDAEPHTSHPDCKATLSYGVTTALQLTGGTYGVSHGTSPTKADLSALGTFWSPEQHEPGHNADRVSTNGSVGELQGAGGSVGGISRHQQLLTLHKPNCTAKHD